MGRYAMYNDVASCIMIASSQCVRMLEIAFAE
jgi:hypothetical protein